MKDKIHNTQSDTPYLVSAAGKRVYFTDTRTPFNRAASQAFTWAERAIKLAGATDDNEFAIMDCEQMVERLEAITGWLHEMLDEADKGRRKSERMAKIKTLAERGVGGEQANAQEIHARLEEAS